MVSGSCLESWSSRRACAGFGSSLCSSHACIKGLALYQLAECHLELSDPQDGVLPEIFKIPFSGYLTKMTAPCHLVVTSGPAAEEVFRRVMQIAEEAFPEFMRAIWGKQPEPQNLGNIVFHDFEV